MSSCLFSFSFIGHILAYIKICHNRVYVSNFLVTFSCKQLIQPSCLSLNTFEKPIDGMSKKEGKSMSYDLGQKDRLEQGFGNEEKARFAVTETKLERALFRNKHPV